MQQFSEFIVRKRRWVIAIWLLVAVLIVSLSPSLSSVESNDQSSFLPKGYESVKAINVANKVSKNSQDPTDVVVFKSNTGQKLTTTDTQTIQTVVNNLSGKRLSHVLSISTNMHELSSNHKIQ